MNFVICFGGRSAAPRWEEIIICCGGATDVSTTWGEGTGEKFTKLCWWDITALCPQISMLSLCDKTACFSWGPSHLVL
jgi:hypothetical protein